MSSTAAESLASFRDRARAFVRANLGPAGESGVMSLRGGRSDEEELAAVARGQEIQRLLADAGLAGICFPREYGGQGLTPEYQAILNEELRGHEYPWHLQSPSIAQCAAVLLEFGTEEQKTQHLPAILRGDEIWMQFLSEPNSGSDLAGAVTTAVREGDEWVLNGSKIWTTGAWWSNWALCLARTNWDVPKHRGLTVFMFPIDLPGIDVHRIELVSGSREFCQEFLTDVRIPDSYRVGEIDGGWSVAVRWLFHERLGFSSHFATSGGSGGRARGRPARPRPRRGGLHARGHRACPGGPALDGDGHGAGVGSVRGGRTAFPWRRQRADDLDLLRARGPGRRGVGRPGHRSRGRRHGLPHPPGRVDRRRNHGDGAQRDQRAGARHAAGAGTGPPGPVPRRPSRLTGSVLSVRSRGRPAAGAFHSGDRPLPARDSGRLRRRRRAP
ncbi:hypothetical protein FAGKG844_20344 [Frankia sp. AgKG'84/4]